MLIELFITLLIGILAGTFTGLFPGIHINTVAALLLASLSYLSSIPPIALVIFIVSMSITHTFLDFIPSIFLGAPDEDSFLSVLPGHELLKNGDGHEAVVLTLYGSLAAIPLILIYSLLFILFLPIVYQLITSIIPFILIFISLFLILSEKEIVPSLVIFILSGFLGLFTFSLPVKEPLLPLLTGLFGISSLIISIKAKTILPRQKIKPLKEITLSKKEIIKTTSAAAFAAPLCSFLPGIGSGHAAAIASTLIKENRKSFLFLVGSLNTIVMGLSFITAYAIGKTRTGSAAAIKTLLKVISPSNVLAILIFIILSGMLSFIIALFISKIFARNISKINYSKLSIAVIIIVLAVNLLLSNLLGILVLLAATFLGIFATLSNSRRINLMGCLLIPSIVFYLLE